MWSKNQRENSKDYELIRKFLSPFFFFKFKKEKISIIASSETLWGSGNGSTSQECQNGEQNT